MTYVDWRIKGPQLSTCNCSVGCPCQFNALPTYGDCRAAVAMHDAGQVGRGREVSAKVETSHPGGVVAERPIYFVYGAATDGGHTVMGFAP